MDDGAPLAAHSIDVLGIVAASERDFWAWAVDISTVIVGIGAVAALLVSAWSLRVERRRKEEAWRRQIALDHHARIYEASASLLQRTTSWAALARARIQARGSAEVDHSYSSTTSDESVDLEYARILDTLGATRETINTALSDAVRSLDHLYFLIGRDGDGERLLTDLLLLSNVFETVRPQMGKDAGSGDLTSVVRDSGVCDDVELLVSLEDLWQPMERVRCVEQLVTRYFRGRVGRFVPPPPLA